MRQVIVLLVVSLAMALAHTKSHHHHHHHGKTEPIVETPLGKFRGSLMESRLGRTIYAFRGIRYAKPPINELRFQPPVAIEAHEGVYNATEDKPMCPQPSDDPVDEDCLILNVYSTALPDKKKGIKRPVIVHIHAGGFYGAGSASYWGGPQYFTDQDIVLVTFNYRLGTLGFLSTGDEHAPGNNGLKDQVQVLKWVQKNIEAFGGDKDSVTILGYSAGSISVLLHLMSPMSQGLFHKAVAMSASATSQWPTGYDLMVLARKQAEFVGCPSNETSENIVKCLKTVPWDKLGNSLDMFYEFGYNPVLIWSPVVERDFGQERFLIDQPVKLIQNRQFQQVPLISGITTDEFGYKALEILGNTTLLEDVNEDWEGKAPILFQYERGTSVSKNASRAFKKSFLNDRPVQNDSLKGLTELYIDGLTGFGINRAVKLISKYSCKPVYYYRFSYQGSYSHVYTPESNFTKPYGVVHHDDLIYLFYIQRLFPKFGATSPKEVEMVAKLTGIHANFATYGNPTPFQSIELDNVTWEPFTPENLKYLDIGKKLEMKEKLYEDRYNQWDRQFPLEHYLTTPNKNCYYEKCD